MQPNRRPALHQRRFWILPEFQGRMVRAWVMMSVGSAAITSGTLLAVLAVIHHRLEKDYIFVELPKHTMQALGNPRFIKMTDIILASFLAAAVFGCVIAVAAGILYSHRIAGPLLRIRRTLGDFLSGRAVDPIVLRENDELKELADDLNRVFRERRG